MHKSQFLGDPLARRIFYRTPQLYPVQISGPKQNPRSVDTAEVTMPLPAHCRSIKYPIFAFLSSLSMSLRRIDPHNAPSTKRCHSKRPSQVSTPEFRVAALVLAAPPAILTAVVTSEHQYQAPDTRCVSESRMARPVPMGRQKRKS